MKKLRKLDFDKFEQMSNDEANKLRGGITVTYKYSSGNYQVGGTVSTGSITVGGTIKF